jgi:hypothetical protein
MKKEVVFKFPVTKEVETEKEEQSVNENGDTVIVKKKVKESKKIYYGVFKASRALREEAEIYRAAEFGKAVDGGATTVTLLQKKYENAGGVYSNLEQTERKSLYRQLLESNQSIKVLEAKEVRSKEEDSTLESLKAENQILINSIIDIESKNENLFANTAEAIAKDRTILFYTLYMAARQTEAGDFEELFSGNKNDRFDQLDELEKGDEGDITAFSTIWGIVALWYANPKLTQADLDKYLKTS